MIAAVWAEVLNVERVGRQDDFFALGGHSLLAVTVIERLRREGLAGDVRTLFATPALMEWAASVSASTPEIVVPPNDIPPAAERITPAMLPLVALTAAEIATVVVAVPGGAPNVQDIYPLAPLQEGVLFHHLLGGPGDPYLQAGLLTFDTRERLEPLSGRAAESRGTARHSADRGPLGGPPRSPSRWCGAQRDSASRK